MVNLLTIARVWLAFLALFELPSIYAHLIQDKRATSFYNRMNNSGPERRLWSMVLVLLVTSRAIACAAPTPASMTHCACVHIVEALFFGAERLFYKGACEPIILGIIILNAMFFSYIALAV